MRWSARTCHLRLVVLCGIAGAGGASCTQEATLRIRISAPDDAALSPLDARLALVSMQVTGPSIATQIQSRPVVRGEALDLGEVPLADDLTITIAASDSAGRLLGFGRSDAPVDVSEGTQAEVSVRLRRPFSYLTGGTAVTALDPTFDITGPYRRDVAGTGAATVVAVPPDGKDIIVVEGTLVRVIDTATHAPAPGISALVVAAGARDAMVSPDSRFLVISHPTGVSLIVLADLRAGTAAPQFLQLGSASSIAFSHGVAWVLIDGSDAACPAAQSSLVSIDLASGNPGAAMPMQAAISDLAADAASGTMLAATPCLNAVKMINTDVGAPVLTEFLENVPLASEVVALNGRVWALGSVDAEIVMVPDPSRPGQTRPASDGTAHLVLVTKDMGAGAPTSINLPVPEELARALDLGLADVPGQSAEVRMGADTVRPLDLAVLPDGSRLAVLWNGSYEAIFFGRNPLTGGVLINSIELTTSEYQLLDAATGAPLQRLRTLCDGTVDVNDGGFLERFACVQSPGQDVVADDSNFAPTHVAVLFGER